MNRDSKRRFLPQLDSLEGRQLLAGGGAAAARFGHILRAMRDAADSDARQAPAPFVRVQSSMAVHAERNGNGAFAKLKFPKNRAMPGRLKLNLRRQPTPKIVVTPKIVAAPTPPPTAPTFVVPAATAAVAAPSVALAPTEQAIVDLTNGQRTINGLAPLATNGKLVQAAQIHAGNMARLDQMSHVLSGVAQPDLFSRAQAVGYSFARLGENIAFRYAGAPEVVDGWMNSAGHKANILNPSFNEIGVAIAANSKGELYYAQVFGQSA
jgi:uncharacterized protein YkwD